MNKLKIKPILFTIVLGAMLSSCASNKPNGMRKSKKRNCDCPSFGAIQHEAPQTCSLVING